MRTTTPTSGRTQSEFRITHSAFRNGFTLIELLVVIAIMTILMALAVGAYFRVYGSQQVRKTETNMKTINTGLEGQWNAVIDDVKDEIKNGRMPAAFMTLAGGDQERAKALYMKARLKQEFPMTFDEARNPAPGYLAAKPFYTQALQGAMGGSNTDQSSALLYLALSQQRRGASFNADQLGPGATADVAFSSAALKVFIDGWKRTISFERWTEDNGFAAEMTGTHGDRDPEDPSNKLTQSWANKSAAELLLRIPTGTGQSPFPAANRYRGPFLRSDGASAGSGMTGDDILSFRLAREGRRGN